MKPKRQKRLFWFEIALSSADNFNQHTRSKQHGLICGDLLRESQAMKSISSDSIGKLHLESILGRSLQTQGSQDPSNRKISRMSKSSDLTVLSSALEISNLYHLEPYLRNVIPSRHSNLIQIRITSFVCMESVQIVLIPITLLHISKSAFQYSGLRNIIFSRNPRINCLESYSFANCDELSSIVFPKMNSKLKIGESAFSHCSKLSKIQIPSLRKLSDSVFSSSGLQLVNLPQDSTLKKIGLKAFQDCSILRSIQIPSSVLELGEHCFHSSGLKSITFSPKSKLKKISNHAFENCSNLRSIEIPSSVEELGMSSFHSCDLRTIVIPHDSNLKKIGVSAFASCINLRSIELPSSVETLGGYCFKHSGLISICFSPKSKLKKISPHMFERCVDLKSIEIPSSVEE